MSRGRVRLETETRRRQLLEVGKGLFSTYSYDELSTAALARQAQVSTGLLYHYFGSKRGFYLAVVEQLADDLIEATAPSESDDLGAVVEHALSMFYRFVQARGPLFRALIRGGIGSDQEVELQVNRVRDTIVHRLLALVASEEADAALRWRLYAWVGAVEALALLASDDDALTEQLFVSILAQVLSGALGGGVISTR